MCAFVMPKFEFGTQVYNVTLNIALGRLQALRESMQRREAANRTEYGLATIANDHRNAAKVYLQCAERPENPFRFERNSQVSAGGDSGLTRAA